MIDGEPKFQIVLPKQLRPDVLKALHEDAGHIGRDRTLQLLQDHLFGLK